MSAANRDEIDVLILDEVSRIISRSGGLPRVFPEVMAVLASRLDFQRGLLILHRGGPLRIEAAFGVPPEETERIAGALGTGVAGRVVSSGKPLVLHDVREAGDFPDALAPLPGERPTSLLCVPILLEGKAAGVLLAEKLFHGDRVLAREKRLLQIIAASVAQALRIQELIRREKEELVQENYALREELRSRYTIENIVGASGKIQEALDTVQRVAKSRASILVTGETGTGKELIAHTIHHLSARSNRPFVRVNCGALSDTLLESELFGHVRGAFTGAYKDRKGRFETAEGGTIFLDEISEMSPTLQVRLLRILQEREFERVGEAIPVRVDCRVIAATNRNLEEEIRAGRFREDLYFRLNVIPIHVPSLRERREDIPLFVEHFLGRFNRENCKVVQKVSERTLRTLMDYPWPGNVREFENVIERAVVMAKGNELLLDFLPFTARERGEAPEGETLREMAQRVLADEAVAPAGEGEVVDGAVEGRPYRRFIRAAERCLFEEALKRLKGVQKETAEFLGINRNTLHKKLKELGVLDAFRGTEEPAAAEGGVAASPAQAVRVPSSEFRVRSSATR